mgnify:CR=1 FL=1
MGSQLLARNRWLVVTGAIIIQLALGALYAWSVFTARLTDLGGAYAFSASETAWVFSTGLATFAIVMVMAGRILPRTGPRPLAIAGGVLLGAGFVLGGLFGETFIVQLICVGVIAGTGIGLSVVLECIQAHDGSVSLVDTGEFPGAHFRIQIPQRRAVAQQKMAANA